MNPIVKAIRAGKPRIMESESDLGFRKIVAYWGRGRGHCAIGSRMFWIKQFSVYRFDRFSKTSFSDLIEFLGGRLVGLEWDSLNGGYWFVYDFGTSRPRKVAASIALAEAVLDGGRSKAERFEFVG